MADPVTMSDVAGLYREHSDIRREAAEHTNEIVKEGIKGDYNTGSAIKDIRYDISSRVENAADRVQRDVDMVGDRLTDRFFTVARDTADIRAQIVAQQQQLVAGFSAAAKDSELAVLRNTIENQKNTQYLADRIGNEGDKTRALINELKYQDLNRALIERSGELFDERHHARHWRGHYDQAQYAALQSNLQAFQSQLQETRQGMVNFGTMAGVGQTSTSNNVR